MEPVECRAVIRFLYLKGRTPQETFDEMKGTYGDDAPSYDLVKRWHREFKHGRKSVETAPKPGRPSSAIDEASVRQVEAAILEDRRITIRQIAQEVKISTGSVETIIHNHLHMRKVSARWIPRLLTPFQKQERVECSRMNLEMCQEDESKFFKRLITQDETWVHHYDPETKSQSMQWKHLDSPPPKKARVQPSAGKVMLTVFWDQDGVVMTDFLAKGTTITGAYYASLLMKLREAIKIKRRGKISKGILLLQDNAPVHNSHVARSEARACGYEILPHPPYSPDLAPSDFHLFPAMKLFLKGKRFPDDAALISEVTTWLEDQPGVFYKNGVQNCIKRWEKCITLGGSYVEKD